MTMNTVLPRFASQFLKTMVQKWFGRTRKTYLATHRRKKYRVKVRRKRTKRRPNFGQIILLKSFSPAKTHRMPSMTIMTCAGACVSSFYAYRSTNNRCRRMVTYIYIRQNMAWYIYTSINCNIMFSSFLFSRISYETHFSECNQIVETKSHISRCAAPVYKPSFHRRCVIFLDAAIWFVYCQVPQRIRCFITKQTNATCFGGTNTRIVTQDGPDAKGVSYLPHLT